jgi:hypothetical protein
MVQVVPEGLALHPVVRAGKAVRGTAHVVDERVNPISLEGADDTEAGAARIDAAVEVLGHRIERGGLGKEVVPDVRAVVVPADIDMEAAGQRNAIQIVNVGGPRLRPHSGDTLDGADRGPIQQIEGRYKGVILATAVGAAGGGGNAALGAADGEAA